MRELSRRRFVQGTGAAVAAGALAGCTGDGDGADDGDDDVGNGEDGDVPQEIDEFLDGANLYDGSIADHTGEDEVTVAVGAGNGLAYDPPAIRIDSGTTVVWEWTGEGGGHNVVSTEDSDSDFESDLTDEEGHTFEQSFDDDGLQFYVCTPHEAQGMLGAIEVVDE